VTGSPLVLIVEDETMIAMMVEDELVDAGYAVAGPFATCRSALAWLSTNTPNLAVLDTQLQDGSLSGPRRSVAKARHSVRGVFWIN
jgi:DNA-binding response OmpR family regulator